MAIKTEQVWIPQNKNIGRLCHLSKNLYNQANYIIKQELEKTGNWVRYQELNSILKNQDEFNNYKLLPAQTAQWTLKLLDKSWSSFFRAIKDWKLHPEKYKEKPNSPRYKKKNGEHILVFTNQQAKIKDDILKLPKKLGLKIKTRLSDSTDLREVRIIPKGVGYVCEIVYKSEVEKNDTLNTDRIVGIDFGAKNIITMVNNIGKKPIVVKDDGRGIKSINQFYNKKKAYLQNIYDQQKIYYGDKLTKLQTKRDKKVHDYMHKLSRFVVNWCSKHNIGTLVIGYNQDWKQRINIGKRNNQTFTQIPFIRIIDKILYKAEEIGIDVKKQEESHTSKCSFLDNESVEHHEQYIGKRISRSLFKSGTGQIIHADVNAAYNIIKKAIPNTFSNECLWIGGCGLQPLRCLITSNKKV